MCFYIWHIHYLTEREVQQFAEKVIANWLPRKFQSKVEYNSSEIDLLPLQPIFHKEIHCAECNYKTKVRINMIRHLGMHKLGNVVISHEVARVDPINPMPCLNSNEKHFDKMTNLASSSLVPSNSSTMQTNTTAIDYSTANDINTTINTSTTTTTISTTTTITNNDEINFNNMEVQETCVENKEPVKLKTIYEYIPNTRIYTCGVIGCQYMTLSEEIFRSHVITLHSDAQNYICPFCQEEVCKRGISMPRIILHLRFHGQWLHQCEECGYLHFVRAVINRHIHEKHLNFIKGIINLISYDRITNFGETTPVNVRKRLLENDKRNMLAPSLPTPIVLPVSELGSAPSTTIATNSKLKKEIRWHCDLCSHFTKTYNRIISHCNCCHGFKQRYQCELCPQGFAQIDQIMKHFKEMHIGQKVVLKTIFHREVVEVEVDANAANGNLDDKNSEANTKPLWQRNDPQRVRHIRGILMEDEQETEAHRKRLRLDDDDDVVEIF